MLGLASKLLNLAVSSQDCTRNDLRRSKIQNFLGGGPLDPPYETPFARFLRFSVGALRAPCHCAPTISSLNYAKRSLPDQTKIASYGPGSSYMLSQYTIAMTGVMKLTYWPFGHSAGVRMYMLL